MLFSREERYLLAFCAAPLVAPTMAVVWASGLGAVAMFGVFAGYVGMIVFGIPTFLFLRSRNWTALWIAAAAGFVFGAIMWPVTLAVVALSLGARFASALEE